jgi:hypothetical protein
MHQCPTFLAVFSQELVLSGLDSAENGVDEGRVQSALTASKAALAHVQSELSKTRA